MLFEKYTILDDIDIDIQYSVHGRILPDDLFNDLDELFEWYGDDADYRIIIVEEFPDIMMN